MAAIFFFSYSILMFFLMVKFDYKRNTDHWLTNFNLTVLLSCFFCIVIFDFLLTNFKEYFAKHNILRKIVQISYKTSLFAWVGINFPAVIFMLILL